MARDTKRNIGIAWDPDPEATQYLIFVDEADDPLFLSEVDSGIADPIAVVDAPTTQWVFPDGHPDNADHAVVSTDGDGRFSDPHSPQGWQDIPLSRPPLAGVTGGRVLSAG